jgi:WD40 repeat protein/tRNA A-37 threonylcarbamoyl transferase component Bud32
MAEKPGPPGTASSVDETLTGSGLHAEASAGLGGAGSDPGEGAAPMPLVTVPDAHYAIVAEQGRGGIGVVLRARDQRLGRIVAVKQLQTTSLAAEDRFEREMRVTARLQHPGVVPVYEAGRFASGVPFYAMKLIEGESLRQLMERATSTSDRLALLPHMVAVADAMAYAHSRGVIHRDLKPSNVIVGPYGETAVIDWGMAKDLSADAEAQEGQGGAEVDDADPELTRPGEVLGTPTYMAPEQALGDAVDARADVWSLGVMLYHLLAGLPPFRGPSSAEILRQVRQGVFRPLAEVQPEVPAELSAIVAHAMARDAASRYAHAGELAADLHRFTTGQLVAAHHYTPATLLARWLRRHRAPVAIAALSLTILAAVGVLSVRNIIASRRQAQSERNKSDARARDLLLAQARAVLERTPTLSLAWLREYLSAGGDPRRVRILAADAWTRGVARKVIPSTGAVRFLFPFAGGVAVAAADGRVSLLDPRSGELRALGTVGHEIVSLVASGSTIVVGDREGGIFLGDIGSASLAPLPVRGSLHASPPVFVLGGRALLVADTESRLRLFDVSTRAAMPMPEMRAMLFSASDDGRMVVTTSGDATELVDLSTSDRRRIEGLGTWWTYAWSPDGKRFGTVGQDHVVRVLRLADDQVQTLPSGFEGEIAFSPDGARLVQAGRDGTFRSWDLATGAKREPWHQRHGLSSPIFVAQGSQVLASSNDGEVVMIRLEDEDVRFMTGIEHGTLTVSLDGKQLVASGSSTLSIWDPEDGPPRVLTGSTGSGLATVALADDGSRAALVGAKGEVIVVDLPGGAQRALGTIDIGPEPEFQPPVRRGPRLAWSPDGRRLAASSADGTIQVLSLDGAPPVVLQGHAGPVYGLAFVDGSRLVSAGEDGSVRSWDVAAAGGVVLGRHAQPIRAFALSPSRRLLATGDKSGGLELRELPSGKLVRRLVGHEQLIMSLAFSADETRLASGGFDHSVRVWELASGNGRTFAGHTGGVGAVAFAPDGRTLASGSYDTCIRLWDLATGQARVLEGHAFAVTDLDFSADGARLVSTGNSDASARLWDVATGNSRSIHHRGSTTFVRFLPGDRQVVSGGSELRLWSDDLPFDAPGLARWIDAHTNAVTPEIDHP